jgi:hypothetical protein
MEERSRPGRGLAGVAAGCWAEQARAERKRARRRVRGDADIRVVSG